MAAILSQPQCVNSLAPGRCGSNFRYVILKHIQWTDILNFYIRMSLRLMPQDLIDDS